MSKDELKIFAMSIDKLLELKEIDYVRTILQTVISDANKAAAATEAKTENI
ncbi:MAG: hypothetical protein FWF44_07760 [Defluviitaleaceae bacterium]|nr:hypothetical protein [Defluviitaleaceae bacterium]